MSLYIIIAIAFFVTPSKYFDSSVGQLAEKALVATRNFLSF